MDTREDARARSIVSSVNDIAVAACGRGRYRGPARGQPDQPQHSGEAAPGSEKLAAARSTAAELLTAISVIRRTARRAARRAWARQPLPPAQSELLRLAAARPGLTVADAAQELRLAPNTVSTLVGRLTEAGLLSRDKSPQDGRTALLTATEKARQRLAEFRDLRADLAGQALARLTEEDRRALARAAPALLRLSDEMERHEPAAR
jgi:DNA-binding MarR family transcriptional regulator